MKIRTAIGPRRVRPSDQLWGMLNLVGIGIRRHPSPSAAEDARARVRMGIRVRVRVQDVWGWVLIDVITLVATLVFE